MYALSSLKPSKKCSASNMTSSARRPASRIESAIMVRFSPRLTPSAPSACRAELLPTSVITGVRAWNSVTRPGSLAALRPERRVMPKAHSLARRSSGGLAKKASSVGLAPGQPPST